MQLKISALLVLALVLLASSASAQIINPPGSGYGDMVSPYLNLLQNQSSNGVGINGLPIYQTIVRPQIEARQAASANQAGIQQLQGQINGGGRGGPKNRHYMNYSHYYLGIRP